MIVSSCSDGGKTSQSVELQRPNFDDKVSQEVGASRSLSERFGRVAGSGHAGNQPIKL